MTLDDAARTLALVLRAENDLLAAGDMEGAAAVLPRKQAAVAALQGAPVPGTLDGGIGGELRALAGANRALLAQAIDVQGRVVEMVGRAARAAMPGPMRYGAGGRASPELVAMALALRA